MKELFYDIAGGNIHQNSCLQENKILVIYNIGLWCTFTYAGFYCVVLLAMLRLLFLARVFIFLTAMFCILQLKVEAKVLNSDLEHNLLSTAVPVFISVSDVDDNFPRFVQRSYR